MSKTSRLLIIVLVILGAVTPAGCAGSAADDQNRNNAGNRTETETPAKPTQLDQIKKAGVMKVGLMGTYPPYNFMNDKHEIDGFDADIGQGSGETAWRES